MSELKNDKEVQTGDIAGGLRFFETIRAAWDYAEEDKTVWKVSWTDSDTLERVRFVRTNSGDWRYEPIDISARRQASMDRHRSSIGGTWNSSTERG